METYGKEMTESSCELPCILIRFLARSLYSSILPLRLPDLQRTLRLLGDLRDLSPNL